ncbi:MAG: acyl-CoA carboxylase epsilon subunit [Egibacteraceae bacterium]
MSLPPDARVHVLRGDPTPEQLAVLIAALDQATPDIVVPGPAPRAWRRAARLEGLGDAPLKSADDPRLHDPSPF